MDTLKFAREHDRMCNMYRESSTGGICLGCPISGKCVCDDWTQTVPIIEKWSKEHPKVTNLDHVTKELEKLGYKVDIDLTNYCPPKFSVLFSKVKPCRGSNCSECIKWWLEEYKGVENE